MKYTQPKLLLVSLFRMKRPGLAIGVGQTALQRWGFVCLIVLHFLQPYIYFVHKQAALFL